MNEIKVHGALLSILRKAAIPWGFDVNTGCIGEVRVRTNKGRPLVLGNRGIGERITREDVVTGINFTVFLCLRYRRDGGVRTSIRNEA